MRRLQKIFILLFIGTSLWLWTAALIVNGVGVEDKKAIDKLIERTRAKISEQKKREKSVLGSLLEQQQELDKLEQNYDRIRENLTEAQKKVSLTQQELRELQNDLGELEHNLQERQRVLNNRIVVAYKYGPKSFLEIFFAARDFADFLDRFNLIAFFVKNDLRLINEIESTKMEVAAQQEAVQIKNRIVESEFKKMVALRDEVSREQQKITSKVRSTKKELSKIQSDRVKLEQALEEYEETSREIETEIRKMEQASSNTAALGTGKMSWPTRGRISSNFGWRMHPILKRQKFHSGVDIAVPSGTPVLAADSGVVLVSGWKAGYGYFVAISHGGGISTCYGHNSRLLVKVGDKVVKGQKIALSGNTGLSSGPHLHFEVRKNGTPTNPLSYLP